ncbi:peptidylprolyl isomerase [Elioraea tepida]|jgi:peptidyl-prolyl cis-trans isomerase C|uniref:peptidylprolyl isomerase n=1 Tax=Elioraea tepida TaxID=2843330 RepID=A0A975U3N5_9PROT|nr:peptidylprolyl isomerase [Elioraea tepida]QXM25392.1 peptidylprolyl isomerase [Elioraea tepida]
MPGLPSRPALLAAALLLASPAAVAQVQPLAPASDPVVARVDGTPIHLSELEEAVRGLPEQFRAMPPQVLYPVMLDQLITQRVLVNAARKLNLQDTPEVRARIRRAEEEALQQALLAREIGPLLTEQALRARYEQDIVSKPQEAEVRARHILVQTETEARQAITALQGGADFATLARERSRGPGAAEGGDLGFFKREEMPEAFAAAAFALEPGQFTTMPVRTQFGWHVIKLEERREEPRPSFEQAEEGLRRAIIEEAATRVVERLRAEASVERFALDGAPIAAPPLAPATPRR